MTSRENWKVARGCVDGVRYDRIGTDDDKVKNMTMCTRRNEDVLGNVKVSE